MMNISPIGRNCSREERNDYEKIDLAQDIRKNMVAAMKKEFADLNLTFSIGGQISFDVFPAGWDKTYCLKFLAEGEFDEIHFFLRWINTTRVLVEIWFTAFSFTGCFCGFYELVLFRASCDTWTKKMCFCER